MMSERLTQKMERALRLLREGRRIRRLDLGLQRPTGLYIDGFAAMGSVTRSTMDALERRGLVSRTEDGWALVEASGTPEETGE